jgi:hypothetical protein
MGKINKVNYGVLYARVVCQRLCSALRYFTKDFVRQWEFIIKETTQRITIEIRHYNPIMQLLTCHGILFAINKSTLHITYSRYSSYINVPITKERMLIIMRQIKNELKRYEIYNM